MGVVDLLLDRRRASRGLGGLGVDALGGQVAVQRRFVQGVVVGHDRPEQRHALGARRVGQDGLGGQVGDTAEDRGLLEDEADIGVLVDHLQHLGRRGLAVAAAVIEELRHRDPATRIGHHVAGVTLDLVAVFRDHHAGLGHGRLQRRLGVGLLLGLQLHRDLLQHFRMGQQIGAHPGAELGVGLLLAAGQGDGGEHRQQDGEGRFHAGIQERSKRVCEALGV